MGWGIPSGLELGLAQGLGAGKLLYEEARVLRVEMCFINMRTAFPPTPIWPLKLFPALHVVLSTFAM